MTSDGAKYLPGLEGVPEGAILENWDNGDFMDWFQTEVFPTERWQRYQEGAEATTRVFHGLDELARGPDGEVDEAFVEHFADLSQTIETANADDAFIAVGRSLAGMFLHARLELLARFYVDWHRLQAAWDAAPTWDELESGELPEPGGAAEVEERAALLRDAAGEMGEKGVDEWDSGDFWRWFRDDVRQSPRWRRYVEGVAAGDPLGKGGIDGLAGGPTGEVDAEFVAALEQMIDGTTRAWLGRDGSAASGSTAEWLEAAGDGEFFRDPGLARRFYEGWQRIEGEWERAPGWDELSEGAHDEAGEIDQSAVEAAWEQAGEIEPAVNISLPLGDVVTVEPNAGGSGFTFTAPGGERVEVETEPEAAASSPSGAGAGGGRGLPMRLILGGGGILAVAAVVLVFLLGGGGDGASNDGDAVSTGDGAAGSGVSSGSSSDGGSSSAGSSSGSSAGGAVSGPSREIPVQIQPCDHIDAATVSSLAGNVVGATEAIGKPAPRGGLTSRMHCHFEAANDESLSLTIWLTGPHEEWSTSWLESEVAEPTSVEALDFGDVGELRFEEAIRSYRDDRGDLVTYEYERPYLQVGYFNADGSLVVTITAFMESPRDADGTVHPLGREALEATIVGATRHVYAALVAAQAE